MQTQQFNTEVEAVNFAADEADSAVSQDRILRWHNLDLEPPQLTRRQRGIADMDGMLEQLSGRYNYGGHGATGFASHVE